ncbi:MAG: hypothetical protein ABI233_07555 [Chthoniobacterales bacterium]
MDSAAPRNGLKVIAGILAIFLIAAAYGQWQHHERAMTVRATIASLPNESPEPVPNDKR